MPGKTAYLTADELAAHLRVARGLEPADLVIKHTRFLDVYTGAFLPGDVAVYRGRIVGTQQSYRGLREVDGSSVTVVPGFIDAHVHIESSLLTPARFQQAVLPSGTTTVIWDPHEIANVRGAEGLRWALAATEGLALDVFVMLSSCVPSTSPERALETSGAELHAEDLTALRAHPRVLGLAEMMNYPGLLAGEPDVLRKLLAFQDRRLDGHCPGLRGKDLNAYGTAGIHSCHESTALEEAREKLQKGFHVLIREGSCAKDADALLPLLDDYSSAVIGLCSDDRNPADIAREGHIDWIADKALRAGHRPEVVFRAAGFAAARAYGLEDRGVVAPGFLADVCLVRPKESGRWESGLTVEAVYKHGNLVEPAALESTSVSAPTQALAGRGPNLKLAACTASDFDVRATHGDARQPVRVIGVRRRQIVTDRLEAALPVTKGLVRMDPAQDILKIAVFERHRGTGRRAVGFVKGFGLQRGAFATSINHDSHNAIVVGTDEAVMAAALNRLREIDGGIVVALDETSHEALPLPIGGLMCDRAPQEVAASLERLRGLATALGCTLEEPFIQLSFLALPVIPSLKITDRGLVDVEQFRLVGAVL
ncbi:MAG: adenine deaminase [Nitrospirota bacterium]|nr:adenine deaminase [Nitrospirota bacterium]